VILRPCIAAFKHLRHVITNDTAFLSSRYKGRLLMMCVYDVENKRIPLAFKIMNANNMDNWSWFMRWVLIEVIQFNMKICALTDRHRGIKGVFERPHLGWSVQREERYTNIARNTSQKNYIRKPKNLKRKKIISEMISE
jgi:MULE transposase domain